MSKIHSPAPRRCASSVCRRSSGTSGEHGVGLERRVAREVDSRVDLTEKTSGEKADVDVRRLRPALRIAHRPRSNRLEHAGAVGAGRQAAESAEARRREHVPRIIGTDVHAVGVGLPQLDERVRHRRAVAVEDTNLQPDALAAACRRARGSRASRCPPARSERTGRRSATMSQRGAPASGSCGSIIHNTDDDLSLEHHDRSSVRTPRRRRRRQHGQWHRAEDGHRRIRA